MLLDGDQLRRFMIFHPFAVGKYQAMLASKARFVHYCSAEAAYHIVNSKRMRLRNAVVMNDFLEIEHGAQCLASAWRSSTGEKFKKLIDEMYPGLPDELAKLVDGWAPSFRTDTYITCLSEHDDAEDDLGRLSMWRAYGGPTGVAVVLNPAVFLNVSEAVPAFTSPVAYLTLEDFERELAKVAGNIETNADFLKQDGGRDGLLNSLYHAFRLAVLCTKHPGFAEEREWRIVYTPSHERSDRIISSVELIRGVPQIVHSIPFVDYPEEGFEGAALPKLIDRIIVGPTEFPEQVRLAIVELLSKADVPDPQSKVVCSAIPLRQ